jgi:hypothetical protein
MKAELHIRTVEVRDRTSDVAGSKEVVLYARPGISESALARRAVPATLKPPCSARRRSSSAARRAT